MIEPVDNAEPKLIEQIAHNISRWRLNLPALVLLHVLKPFSFIASQGLLVCQPVLELLITEPRIDGYADLLADRTNVDLLVARLQQETTVQTAARKESNG
ncbi:MAG: hypothetical protein PVI09_03510 [Anaerolineae bacterium]|jgi:hypothetical protein